MNKLATSVALAAIMIAPAVLAQSVGERTGINSALGITPSTQDFVNEAATSDMLEIAAAKVAQDKGNAAGQGQREGKEVRRTDDHRSH